jgi:hypothetical protein
MSQLCQDLTLSIYKDDDRVRIVLRNELDMSEVEQCYQISQNEKPHQSYRYYIKEAVVIALRRVVSQAFEEGMIIDGLGEWRITRPTGKEPLSTPSSTEWDL